MSDRLTLAELEALRLRGENERQRLALVALNTDRDRLHEERNQAQDALDVTVGDLQSVEADRDRLHEQVTRDAETIRGLRAEMAEAQQGYREFVCPRCHGEFLDPDPSKTYEAGILCPSKTGPCSGALKGVIHPVTRRRMVTQGDYDKLRSDLAEVVEALRFASLRNHDRSCGCSACKSINAVLAKHAQAGGGA